MALSWPYRCIPCHRSGRPEPPFSPFRWSSPEANERQRLNALCSHLGDTLIPHILATGHNEWEALDATTGRWEPLGPYVGDGWFGHEWEERDAAGR